jgi:hypothetical protein
MTKAKEKTGSEFKNPAGVNLMSRLTEKECKIGAGDDAPIFVLRALSSRIVTYIQSAAQVSEVDPAHRIARAGWDTVRFGVSDIRGVFDTVTGDPWKPVFQEIEVLGKKVQCLTEESMDIIPGVLIGPIMEKITQLTDLGREELERLDFTIQ